MLVFHLVSIIVIIFAIIIAFILSKPINTFVKSILMNLANLFKIERKNIFTLIKFYLKNVCYKANKAKNSYIKNNNIKLII